MRLHRVSGVTCVCEFVTNPHEEWYGANGEFADGGDAKYVEPVFGARGRNTET